MRRKLLPRRHRPVPPDPRKGTVNLDAIVIEEIEAEALRQGRSRSWIVQQAWLAAREVLRGQPTPFRRFREPPTDR